MDVSVVFPTYNRSRLLLCALQSLLGQSEGLVGVQVEFLVIDNNSKDDTASVVSDFASGAGRTVVRYIKEVRQGLSHARNRGLCEARGAIIAFVDDDIEFSDGWLANMVRFFAENKEIDILGGPVLPFNVTLPPWLPERFFMLVGLWAYAGGLAEVNNVVGCNFCIRRQVAQEVGEFDVSLGRRGELLLMGEENEYFARARKKGYHIYASDNLPVFHKIESKLNIGYIRQNALASGAGLARYDSVEYSACYVALKKGYYLAKLLVNCLSVLFYDGDRRIVHDISRNYIKGYLRGVRIVEGKIR